MFLLIVRSMPEISTMLLFINYKQMNVKTELKKQTVIDGMETTFSKNLFIFVLRFLCEFELY